MHESAEQPRQTPLHDLHLRLGAKMVPFAGYAMPLHYPPGLLKEHQHTRSAAGLFDVSHMGQIVVAPHSGRMADAALALETLIPVDILGLPVGRQRYGFFTDASSGIRDDLMIANLGDRFVIVVNASCKEADEQHLRAHLSDQCHIQVLPNALIALQGPGAEAALMALAPDVAAMDFLDVREVRMLAAPCLISRSGYTGEDGFEISAPADIAEALASRLMADGSVLPIGLGARDSLRLEAGLCLSGSDIDIATTPIQAGLGWAIGKVRRQGGSREGGFPGASSIFAEIANGADRHRVGLLAEGRAPVRAGVSLYAEDVDGSPVGTVTSGGYGPTLGAPVAMGYLPPALAGLGTRVFAEVRGSRLPLKVASMPFIPSRFKRG
jgi:aminomethyltransferase